MNYELLSDEQRLYYSVLNLARKAMLRIRDEAFLLRTTPLSASDQAFKESIEKKFYGNMKWSNFGFVWNITQFELMKKIRQGLTKEELMNPEFFRPVFKRRDSLD